MLFRKTMKIGIFLILVCSFLIFLQLILFVFSDQLYFLFAKNFRLFWCKLYLHPVTKKFFSIFWFSQHITFAINFVQAYYFSFFKLFPLFNNFIDYLRFRKLRKLCLVFVIFGLRKSIVGLSSDFISFYYMFSLRYRLDFLYLLL